MWIRQRRRIRWTGAAVRPAAAKPNERWSMDFVTDCVSTGPVIRLLTMVDDCTRECPVIAILLVYSSQTHGDGCATIVIASDDPRTSVQSSLTGNSRWIY
jgi:putative transposase